MTLAQAIHSAFFRLFELSSQRPERQPQPRLQGATVAQD